MLQLWVFISHLAENKAYVVDLQGELSKYGICSFVAHEDIVPDAEWQDEIEKALRTCDALIVVLHEGFNSSAWTDQEVGYALGRGVPVLSVHHDVAPYGLLGKKQAFKGKDKITTEAAQELFDAYRKHPKTCDKLSDILIQRFCESGSFAAARENIGLVEELAVWKPSYKPLIRTAVEENGQIKHSWGVSERVEAILKEHDPDPDEPEPQSLDEEIPF